MFLKTCKGRKSCLDPIPKLFMIFENLQQRFFYKNFHENDFIKSWNRPPAQSHVFLQIFIVLSSSTFSWFYNRQWIKIFSKIFKKPKIPKTPKTDHPKKVDFDPFSTPLYRPIRTLFRDGAKIVIFEGSRPQNRKKALFWQKNEKWRSGRKGLKLRLALQSSSVPPTRASDPPRALKPSLWWFAIHSKPLRLYVNSTMVFCCFLKK